MADRIKGITVEIGGDVTGLSKALATVNKEAKGTQNQLKDVNKLLKLDPGNTQLLAQKQKLLGQSIDETRKKLQTLKTANEQAAGSVKNYDAWKAKYDPIQKEIDDTEKKLKDLRDKAKDADEQLSSGKISKEKYDSLQSEIKDTEGNLKDLKQQAKDCDEQFGNPISHEQYDGLQREIIETEQDLKSLQKEAKNTDNAVSYTLKQAGSKMKSAGDKISGVGEGLTAGVTTPIMAVGAASVAAFQEVDEGMDTVEEKTGASGKSLEDMQDIVKAIATEIPTDFETAGAAVGEVNTRFGFTGDALKKLSTKFVKFSSLNDTDVSTSIDNVSSVLHAFNMKGDKAGEVLDVMNATGQKTGIGMDTLASDLSQNAAQFKQMGMSAEDAAGFMGMVEMSGLNSSVAMMGLKTAMKVSSKEGKTLNQEISDFSKTMNSNKSESDKLTEAYKIFGSKGGAAIYNAVKSGKLNLQDMSGSLSDFQGSVETTYENTLDPIDKTTTAMNSAKLALADIGGTLMQTLAPVLQDVSSDLKEFSTWWESLPEPMQQFIVKAALVTAAVGPLLTVGGKAISCVGTVVGAIGNLTTKLSGIPSSASTATSGMGGAFSGLNTSVSESCSTIGGTLGTLSAAIGTFAASYEITTAVLKETGAWDWLEQKSGELYDTFHAKAIAAGEDVDKAIDDAMVAVQGGGVSLDTALAELEASYDYYSQQTDTTSQSTAASLASLIDTVKGKMADGSASVNTSLTGVDTKMADTKTKTGQQMSGMATDISTQMGVAGTNALTGGTTISNNLANGMNAGRGSVSLSSTSIRQAAEGGFTPVLSESHGWGADLVNGIASGINGAIGAVRNAASGVASAIRSFLHFSEPDVGPLSDFHTWMPDFMGGIADGIEKNRGLVQRSMSGLAGDMVLSPQGVYAGTVGKAVSVGTDDKSTDYSGLLQSITAAASNSSADKGDITIPVYIGGNLIDEVIVTAQQRMALRSGGR
jgi:phage-related minor tail protein